MNSLLRDRCPSWKYAEAFRMRFDPTDAEECFWKSVKKKKFGFRFHRQKVILGYIVDFWCPRKKLIVEIDGGYHKHKMPHDAQRTQALEQKGFHVIRFTNDEVLRHPEEVRLKLEKAIAAHPTLRYGRIVK